MPSSLLFSMTMVRNAVRALVLVSLGPTLGCGGKLLAEGGDAGRLSNASAGAMPNPTAGTAPSPPSPKPADAGATPDSSGSSASSAPAASSCAQGRSGTSDCGLADDSCCTSLEVVGGAFYRTYDANEDPVEIAVNGPSDEADPATISSFRLDKYLVTVGRFRQFVTAWNHGWLPATGAGKHVHLNGGRGLVNAADPASFEQGWDAEHWNDDIEPTTQALACSPLEGPNFDTWTDAPGDQEWLPMNCVNWYEAYAFCIWDGGFLPSEAEWEYAAAGGMQQREYPWGSSDPATSDEYAIYGCYYPPGSQSCAGASSIAPVGTTKFGAGLWGQLDLAGELYEWNLDWYAAYADPCQDCAYLAQTISRVYRGGYFYSKPEDLLCSTRDNYTPTYRYYGIGFRCARTP